MADFSKFSSINNAVITGKAFTTKFVLDAKVLNSAF